MSAFSFFLRLRTHPAAIASVSTARQPKSPSPSFAGRPERRKGEHVFADGIQDELLSELSKIKDLKVINRTSVMQYKSGVERNLKRSPAIKVLTTCVEGKCRPNR